MQRLLLLAVKAAHRTTNGLRRLGAAAGQGTVEYVALILLVAIIMAGAIGALKGFKTGNGKLLGDVILTKIKDAVTKVQF
ncbi:MAG: hypothetical protein ACJ760_13705 [Thermoleophilaceae bacterium]